MPINHYIDQSFDFYEQNLMNDLTEEIISFNGINTYYIPRNSGQLDIVYGEDPLGVFQSAYPIEVYIEDATGFEGQKNLFSKFGIEIQEDLTVLMSRQAFAKWVGANEQNRPLEGDLMFFPNLRRNNGGVGELFEITFVNVRKDFYMFGRVNPYYYELRLEAFKYSNEIIQTGVTDIDSVPTTEGYTISFTMGTGNGGNYSMFETVYQGSTPSTASANAIVSSWNAPYMTLNVTNIMGVFSDNLPIIGATSNAQYTLISFDPLENNLERIMDNDPVQTEGMDYINESEENPLGDPGGYE